MRKTVRTVIALAAAVLLAVFFFLPSLRSDSVLPSIQEQMTTAMAPEGTEITKREDQPIVVAENAGFKLELYTKSAAISLTDKRSGRIWTSNPLTLEDETIALGQQKERMNAQLSLYYYNSAGQMKEMDSYTEAVKKGQYTLYQLDQGLRVDYDIGDQSKGLESLPSILDEKRLNELFADTDRLTDEEKAFIRKQYIKDKEIDLYRIKNTSAQLIITQIVDIFDKIGYTNEDLQKDSSSFGFEIAKTSRILYTVSVVYRLTDTGFQVEIPVGSLSGPAEYPVASITLLEFFGAVRDGVEGYMVVPDGSGALMRYDSPSPMKSDRYTKPVYGSDAAAFITTGDTGYEIMMPVFGAIQGRDGFIGILEQGDSLASVNAYKAGNTNGLHCIYPSFELTKMSLSVLGEEIGSQVSYVTLFQKNDYKGNLSVEYRFLEQGERSYIDLAAEYRAYLQEHDRLPSKGDSASLYIDTVGGVEGYATKFGVYRTIEVVPLTTYRQNIDILEAFRQAGVDSIQCRLSGWANGGLDQTNAEKIKLIGKLGGKNGFRELASYCEEYAIGLYPSVQLMTSSKGKGFQELSDAARTINQDPARLFLTDLVEGGVDWTMTKTHQGYRYIYSPNRLPALMDSFVKSYSKLGINGLALEDLGTDIYGDYRNDASIDRQTAKAVSEMALDALSGYRLMIDGGKSFSYPWASHVVNIPVSSSEYYLFDESIPFFQAVYHGSMAYAGEPLNESSDSRFDFLKCVEYGNRLHFRFLEENEIALKDTVYSGMFSNRFAEWKETAVEWASRTDEVFRLTAGSTMVGHGIYDGSVMVTEYANGVRVYVNYSDTAYKGDGFTIPAEDFLVKE